MARQIVRTFTAHLEKTGMSSEPEEHVRFDGSEDYYDDDARARLARERFSISEPRSTLARHAVVLSGCNSCFGRTGRWRFRLSPNSIKYIIALRKAPALRQFCVDF